MWQRDENHLALWMLACTMDVGMLSQGYDRSTSAQQGLVSKSGHVKLQPLYTFFCYTSTGKKCYCERYCFTCAPTKPTQQHKGLTWEHIWEPVFVGVVLCLCFLVGGWILGAHFHKGLREHKDTHIHYAQEITASLESCRR